jgi:hypothetical protein
MDSGEADKIERPVSEDWDYDTRDNDIEGEQD